MARRFVNAWSLQPSRLFAPDILWVPDQFGGLDITRRAISDRLAQYDRRPSRFGLALKVSNVSFPVYGTTRQLVTSDGAGTGDFTLLAVAKTPTLGAPFRSIFGQRGTSGGVVAGFLYANNSGAGSLALWNGTSAGATAASGTLGDETWHVLAGRRRGSSHAVWVDGTERATGSATAVTILRSDSRASVGAVWDGAAYTGALTGATQEFGICAAWNRALSDAELAELTRDPWLLIEPPKRRVWVPATSSSQTVETGLTEETDSAFGVTRLKRLAVGLNTETDSVLAATRAKRLAVGLNAETDSAFSLARFKVKIAGLNTEADSAFAVAKAKRYAAGLNTETDTALSVSGAQSILVGIAEAIDTALAVTKRIAKAVGLTTETDEALPVANATVVPVGQATETDSAFSVAKLKRKLVGLAREFDTSRKVTTNVTVSWGLNFPLIRPMVRNLIQSWRSRRFPWKEPF